MLDYQLCTTLPNNPVHTVRLLRWNNTPMDEALHFGHHDVFKILQEYQVQYTPQGDSDNGKENQTVHKNLDGLL